MGFLTPAWDEHTESSSPEPSVPQPGLSTGWQRVQTLRGGREERGEDLHPDTPKHNGAITDASLVLKKKKKKIRLRHRSGKRKPPTALTTE